MIRNRMVLAQNQHVFLLKHADKYFVTERLEKALYQ